MSIKLSLVVSTPDVGPWPMGLLTGSFEEKVAKAAEMGYDGLELLFRDVGAADRGAIQRVIREHKLEVPALVTGAVYGLDKLRLVSPDPEIANCAMERLRGFLEFAGDYGAVVDIGWMRGRLDDMPDPEGAREDLIAKFREAAEYAAHCGSRVTLEPLNRFEADYIHSAQDGLKVVTEVNHPQFGLMLDTFHMNIEDASIEGSLREAASCLWHIHVGDSNRLSPGKGHFDFPGMIQVLKNIGCNGYLSAEHMSDPDADTSAEDTIRHLRRMIRTGE